MPDKASIGPLLVPVDFSSYSEAALLLASELAQCLGVPLVVLHVVHDPGEAPGFYAGKKRNKKRVMRMEDIASEMMDDFLKQVVKEHPNRKSVKKAETMLRIGLPVTRILEVAKKIQARMIVMGSQGRTGLAHIFLGSKAEQVVRLSPIPVTIVKAEVE